VSKFNRGKKGSSNDILCDSVQVIQIEKRKYEIYNCGPEIMNIPSLHKIEQVLEIRDPKVWPYCIEQTQEKTHLNIILR
jgi:hypothetical protein